MKKVDQTAQNKLIEEIISKYKNNPYGFGVDHLVVTEYCLILGFTNEESFRREEILKKLKQLGVSHTRIRKANNPEYLYAKELRVTRIVDDENKK